MIRMKVQFCLVVFLIMLSCFMSQSEDSSVQQNAMDSTTDMQTVDIQSLLDQIASLSTEKDSILRENAEIKKKQNQLEKNIEHLTKKSSYVQELARVEEKYDLLKSESDASAATLRNKITQLESERDEARLEIARIKERQPIVGESTDIKTLQQKIKAHEETIARLSATNERLTQTIADLERRITELQSTLQHISMERDQLHMDVRSAGGAVTKAQKDAHVAKDRYVAAAKRLDEQSATIKELELHHDKCRAYASQLESSVTVLQRQQLNNPFTVLKNKLAALKRFLLRLFGADLSVM